MSYAVFILKAGKWQLHCEFGANLSGAKLEATYLVKSLGMVAQVFKKI